MAGISIEEIHKELANLQGLLKELGQTGVAQDENTQRRRFSLLHALGEGILSFPVCRGGAPLE